MHVGVGMMVCKCTYVGIWVYMGYVCLWAWVCMFVGAGMGPYMIYVITRVLARQRDNCQTNAIVGAHLELIPLVIAGQLVGSI